jgi:uncharacterized protein (TIGR03086 family)
MGCSPDAGSPATGDDVDMTADDRLDDVAALLAAGRDLEAALRGAGLDRPASTSPTPDGGPMDPLLQLAHLEPVLGGVIADLQPDQLELPTPCADFTVRGVLEHMISGATAFAAAYRGDEPAERDLRDPVVAVQAALGELTDAMSAAGALERTIEAPFGEIDGESFARFIVLDGLVHGWDIATATGQPYDPPADVIAAADRFARQAIDPLRDGQTFASAVIPHPDATPIERLAAFTGRPTKEPAR